MNSLHILYSARYAFVATVLVLALALFSFFTFEPSVGRALTDSFTVTQTISNEIAMSVVGDVTMSGGSLSALTGGYSTGTTMVIISTSNPGGYNMTLAFSTSTAMRASSTAYINNYTPSTVNVPDLAWQDTGSGGASEFGYTVRASTTNEIDTSFKNNGSLCGTGSNETDNSCWLNPSTTPEMIINSGIPSFNSTTTLKFKVAVPVGQSPALSSGTYIATGTLTAVVN